MRTSRLVPVVAAAALLVATTSPVQAQPAPEATGVGTTTGALTLLGLDAGDLLTLDLLSDAGSANIDEATGPRSAAAQIAALALDTAATAPLSVPLVSVSSTGEEQQAGQDVALPANPLVSGASLPLSLSALVDEAGARSTLAAGMDDLQVLSGILGVQGGDLSLGSTALTTDAGGTRSVVVDALTVLDLEALLATLGLSLTDLPLEDLLALLDGLGLLDDLEPLLAPLGLDPGDLDPEAVLDLLDGALDEAGSLLGQVDTLTTDISSLEGVADTLAGGTTQTCTTVLAPVLDLLPGAGTVTEVCTTTESAIEDVTGQIDTLEGTLATVRAALDPLLDQLRALLTGDGGILGLLGGATLLDLEGLDIGVTTKATDAIETSVADVTASIGSLQVGDLALPALDLTGPLAEVDAVLGQVTDAVNGVLGQIGAGQLSELVDVTTMQESTSVEQVGEDIVARAEFTGLVVEVAPILDQLDSLLAGLAGVDTLGDVLAGLDLELDPATAGATQVLELNALLSDVTGGLPLLAALEDGMSMQVASISQQSSFAAAATPAAPVAPGAPGAPAAPTAPGALPRTGSDDGLLLALAAAAVLAALGGRQLVRRTASDA